MEYDSNLRLSNDSPSPAPRPVYQRSDTTEAGFSTDDDTTASESVRLRPPKPKEIVVALRPYTAQHDEELSLEKDERIEVRSKKPLIAGGAGWWVGVKLSDNSFGVFPTTHVGSDVRATVDSFCQTNTSSGAQIPKIKFNELTLGTRIGSGGFGEVFEAVYRAQSVAVKKAFLSRQDDASIDEKIKDIQLEARICHCLNDVNIVQLIGISTNSPHNLCIVFEHCAGGSLFTVLKSHHDVIPTETWLDWTSQIASGMSYLHNGPLPIVHRDLKSNNVLVKEPIDTSDPAWFSKKTLKITDFGLSKEQGGEKTKSLGIGAFAWLAPECIKQSSAASPASDVWSFGVVVWEVVTGEIPYKDSDNCAIAWNVAREVFNLRIPDSCPNKLRNLMKGCWQYLPYERPTFEQIVKSLALTIETKEELQAMKAIVKDEVADILELMKTWEVELEEREGSIENQRQRIDNELQKKMNDMMEREAQLNAREAQFSKEQLEFERIKIANELTLAMQQLTNSADVMPKERRGKMNKRWLNKIGKATEISGPLDVRHLGHVDYVVKNGPPTYHLKIPTAGDSPTTSGAVDLKTPVNSSFDERNGSRSTLSDLDTSSGDGLDRIGTPHKSSAPVPLTSLAIPEEQFPGGGGNSGGSASSNHPPYNRTGSLPQHRVKRCRTPISPQAAGHWPQSATVSSNQPHFGLGQSEDNRSQSSDASDVLDTRVSETPRGRKAKKSAFPGNILNSFRQFGVSRGLSKSIPTKLDHIIVVAGGGGDSSSKSSGLNGHASRDSTNGQMVRSQDGYLTGDQDSNTASSSPRKRSDRNPFSIILKLTSGKKKSSEGSPRRNPSVQSQNSRKLSKSRESIAQSSVNSNVYQSDLVLSPGASYTRMPNNTPSSNEPIFCPGQEYGQGPFLNGFHSSPSSVQNSPMHVRDYSAGGGVRRQLPANCLTTEGMSGLLPTTTAPLIAPSSDDRSRNVTRPNNLQMKHLPSPSSNSKLRRQSPATTKGSPPVQPMGTGPMQTTASTRTYVRPDMKSPFAQQSFPVHSSSNIAAGPVGAATTNGISGSRAQSVDARRASHESSYLYQLHYPAKNGNSPAVVAPRPPPRSTTRGLISGSGTVPRNHKFESRYVQHPGLAQGRLPPPSTSSSRTMSPPHQVSGSRTRSRPGAGPRKITDVEFRNASRNVNPLMQSNSANDVLRVQPAGFVGGLSSSNANVSNPNYTSQLPFSPNAAQLRPMQSQQLSAAHGRRNAPAQSMAHSNTASVTIGPRGPPPRPDTLDIDNPVYENGPISETPGESGISTGGSSFASSADALLASSTVEKRFLPEESSRMKLPPPLPPRSTADSSWWIDEDGAPALKIDRNPVQRSPARRSRDRPGATLAPRTIAPYANSNECNITPSS